MDNISEIVLNVRIHTLSLDICNVRKAGVQATKERVRTPAANVSLPLTLAAG